MNRRSFMAVTGAAGVGALSGLGSAAAAAAGAGRVHLELQKYTLEGAAQKESLDAFLKEAAIPAWNRLGIKPVGVFNDMKEVSPVYVLLPHPTLEGAATANHKLAADKEFAAKAAAFLGAPKASKPYAELESWLMVAFKGMPGVEAPVKGAGRVFQLRIYESPSFQTGQKKIEMFNDAGEIRIFREVGLNPVFFGEALFGGRMPNLTYMLGFESEEAQKEAWGKFGKHPDWLKLRGMAEYADGTILRNIVNIPLKPAAYSQV
jgi:hypothetical protein